MLQCLLALSLALAAPPTVTVSPVPRVGYGPVTLSGTAAPGSVVTLWEAAYVYRTDMNRAVNWDTGAPLTARADAGGTIQVHTGRGADDARNRYWNRSGTVWNNDGDTATLRDAGGSVVDTCGWSAGPGSTTC